MTDAPSHSEIAALTEVAQSPCRHMELCVKWVDDGGRTWAGPYVMPDDEQLEMMGGERPAANTLQQRIEDALRWCKAKRRPARIIVLKGRRSGSSTVCADVVNMECRDKETQALVMADVFKRSDEIFNILTNFAETDVFPWTAPDWDSEVLPGEGVVAKEKSLSYPNGSVVKKETAMDPNAGRGGGFRVLWFSEVAHFPSDGKRDAKRLMVSTLNTVPKIAGTIVICESTGNGRQGWFYERWENAAWPEYDDYWKKWDANRGNADPDEMWVRVFASWFEIPRNAIPVTPEEAAAIMARLTPAEQAGVDRYGWTPEQLKWRRWTVKNDFSGDETMFEQEYPSDPESAFVLTGAPAFNRDALKILRQAAEQAEWKCGVMEAVGASFEQVLAGKEMADIPIIFRQTPVEGAWCRVLELPKDGCRYLVTCDVASMAEIAKNTGILDSTSILVIRAAYDQEKDGKMYRHRPRVVARIMPEVMAVHPPANLTGFALALLTRMYGNPPVVIEKEKGEWLILLAKQAGLNLWRDRHMDRARQKITETLGFSTNEESRHTIVTTLQNVVHGSEVETEHGRVWTPSIDVECPHIVGQMETFVLSANGRYEAATGKHDDDVMALGIGVLCLPAATTYRTRKRRRQE